MARTLKEADLGTAAPGAKLMFNVTGKGFSANAMLDCDMKLVASWESVELLGQTVEETLIPAGLYTLQVSIAFRTKKKSSAKLTFSLLVDEASVEKAVLSFTGKTKDIARAVVFIGIQ